MPSGIQRPQSFYPWYVLAVLTLLYMIAFVDRQVLSLLVDPIRGDLDISDTQLSLLQGFAFALFYTVFGVLLGWAADIWNRRNLIFLGLLVWGASTVSSGLATSFVGLFLARLMVGMGEGTLSPAAYSLIYDYFDSNRRGRATSIYSIGVVLGSGAAYILGGAVIEAGDSLMHMLAFLPNQLLAPWRVTFLVIGSFSLLALVLIATVKEPVRTAYVDTRQSARRSNPIGCFRYIWDNFHYHGRIILGIGIGSIVFNGIFAWAPSHFIRVFDWTASSFGMAFGVILLLFGPAGMLLAGHWSDRAIVRGKLEGPAKIILLGETVGGLGGVVFGFAPTPALALAVLSLCVFSFSSVLAVAPLALQSVTPANLRSQMIAFYLLLANVLGLGIGPTVIAGVSDYVLKEERLIGVALSLVALVVMPAAIYFLFGAWKWRKSYMPTDPIRSDYE